FDWLNRSGLGALIDETAKLLKGGAPAGALDVLETRYAETWQAQAGLKTYGQAVADVMTFRAGEGQHFDMTVQDWLAFSKRASHTSSAPAGAPPLRSLAVSSM